MKTNREQLVEKLTQLLQAAQSNKEGFDHEADLAHDLQATSGWWVKQVEKTMPLQSME